LTAKGRAPWGRARGEEIRRARGEHARPGRGLEQGRATGELEGAETPAEDDHGRIFEES
jgi:hypothetical protein